MGLAFHKFFHPALSILLVGYLSACAIIPGDGYYLGPKPRPAEMEKYYAEEGTYGSFKIESVRRKAKYHHQLLTVETPQGEIVIDYFQRPQSSENLIFVFPILGGKHILEDYFARYFAEHGFDTAIVHRDKDFKRPEQFDHVEEIFRRNVVRDRIAITFFEKEFDKKKFGSFGMSRGAINAAITAGVDPRLEFNVLAMGGSNVVDLFRETDVRGVKKYREKVKALKGITDEQFFDFLEESIVTDPKNVARYIDARKTLMILGAFDQSVPIKYGMRLRRSIGHPRTVFLPSGHITSVLYTRFVPLIPPTRKVGGFPFDFIESEALQFYNNSFETDRFDFFRLPFVIMQLPFEILGRIYFSLF